MLRVEGLGIRFGIDDHPDASVIFGHLQRQSEHEPEKLQAEPQSLG